MAYGTPRELYLSRLAAGLREKHAGSSGARLCKVYGAPVEFQRFAKRQGSAHKPPLQRASNEQRHSEQAPHRGETEEVGSSQSPCVLEHTHRERGREGEVEGG